MSKYSTTARACIYAQAILQASVRSMAQRLNISPGTWQHCRMGRMRPSKAILEKLAHLSGCESVSQLIARAHSD